MHRSVKSLVVHFIFLSFKMITKTNLVKEKFNTFIDILTQIESKPIIISQLKTTNQAS